MPRLTIDLDKIAANTRLVAGILAPYDLRLVGVTKACLGNWQVGAAMMAGGAAGLADSRGASIARLRRRLTGAPLELLRSQPGDLPPGEPPDYYFVSSVEQAAAVLAGGNPGPASFILMIETGDNREGVMPARAAAEAVRLAALPGACLAGVATITACSTITPSLRKPLDDFRTAASGVIAAAAPGRRSIEATREPFVLSAGGSGLLGLLLEEDDGGWLAETFGELTELRCGEALLLGNVPGGGGATAALAGAHRDACVLTAPVLEIARKRGHCQALVALGSQDIGAGSVTPEEPGLAAVRATSDYLALDCDRIPALPAVGELLSFIPDYYALLGAMTSPFVEKELAGSGTA